MAPGLRHDPGPFFYAPFGTNRVMPPCLRERLARRRLPLLATLVFAVVGLAWAFLVPVAVLADDGGIACDGGTSNRSKAIAVGPEVRCGLGTNEVCKLMMLRAFPWCARLPMRFTGACPTEPRTWTTWPKKVGSG